MLDRIGAIAVIARVENKQRLLRIEAAAGREIQAGNRALQGAFEGIVAGEQEEQQNGQGEEIRAAVGAGAAEGHLRRHEAPGAHHGPATAAAHLHVVVIADQNPTPARVEEDIAE